MAACDCYRRPAAVTRSATRRKNASLAEREQIWFTLTEDVAHDLDARFEQEITEGLRRFIVR